MRPGARGVCDLRGVTENAPQADRAQREIWRDEREALGLVPGAPGFGRRGVMERLDGQAVQVVLLPSDPSVAAVEFDAALARALPDRFTGQISNGVQRLGHVSASSGHLLKEAQGEEGSRGLLAVARHGGVLVGVGERSGRYFLNGKDGPVAQRLSVVSGAVRLAFAAQADALAHLAALDLWAPSGPWEVSVALPGARGAVLGAFASGWEEPDRAFDVFECGEDDPLVTLELADVPKDVHDRREALRRVLARVVNAFGTTLPLYLPHNNTAGEIPDEY